MSRMLKAIVVFTFFLFVYTLIWYLITPVVDVLANSFSNVNTGGWSSTAQTTYNLVISVLKYSWTWIGILSFVSTLIWYFIWSYREEAESRIEPGYYSQ